MNQEIIVEKFYNEHLKNKIELNLSDKENALALKLVKAISYKLWSDNRMSKEVLEEYLHGYNQNNLIYTLNNLISEVRKGNVKNTIFMRDFTDIPKHIIFYNQDIEHNQDGDKLRTIFKNIKIFSSKDMNIGTQIGKVNKDGSLELTHFEESNFDYEGCYIMLSFKETLNITKNTKTEHIFIDCYLGNYDFN